MQSPEIRVVDEFLPGEIYQRLGKMLQEERMIYGARSNSRTDPHGHWATRFVVAGQENLANVEHQLRPERLRPVADAWSYAREKYLADCVLLRCYMNAYTYGTDGYFHKDSERPDETTIVLYLADEWDPDWAGETLFLENGELIKAVLPRGNRAVLFPSNLMHAARGVSRKCTGLRKTLIFKSRKSRSNLFEAVSHFLVEAGATRAKHRRGSLHDHLMRTFAILEERRCAEALCVSGGLHSIYGTNRYKNALLQQSERQKVAAQFGAASERLAFIFSLLNRPNTLESPLSYEKDCITLLMRSGDRLEVTPDFLRCLRLVEAANLEDQHALANYPELRRVWESERVNAARGIT